MIDINLTGIQFMLIVLSVVLVAVIVRLELYIHAIKIRINMDGHNWYIAAKMFKKLGIDVPIQDLGEANDGSNDE